MLVGHVVVMGISTLTLISARRGAHEHQDYMNAMAASQASPIHAGKVHQLQDPKSSPTVSKMATAFTLYTNPSIHGRQLVKEKWLGKCTFVVAEGPAVLLRF